MRASNFHGQEKEKCNFLNSDVQSFISPSFQLPGLCARAPCSCAWITRLSRLKSCSDTLLRAPTYIHQWPLLAFMSRQKINTPRLATNFTLSLLCRAPQAHSLYALIGHCLPPLHLWWQQWQCLQMINECHQSNSTVSACKLKPATLSVHTISLPM